MKQPNVMNRWWVVAGGILIQLCLGAIYAWSAFTGPLTRRVPRERVIPAFTARELGIDPQTWEAVKREVAPFQEEWSRVAEALRQEQSADRKKSLQQRLTELSEDITRRLFAAVPQGNVDRLRYEFSKTQSQIIFSVGLLTFAVIMAMVAGRWQRRAGPRVVALTGGIVLGLGYMLAGLSGTSFWGILLGVGLLGGAGIGLGYVCPIAALVKWFPDKKGLITGLAVAGFGFGALIWIKLTSGFNFGPVDLTPGWAGLYGMGWTASQVFILYGIVFAALVALGSVVMVNPPEGWRPEDWTPPDVSASGGSGGIEFTEREMVVTPQFRTLFCAFLVGATAGLMVIGVIQLFAKDALTSRGMTDLQANTIAGTAMGLFYALMNGLGRIIWGKISDGIGRKAAIAAMSTLQGVMMMVFYWAGTRPLGLYIGAAVIGFNFGGNFALFPAATADYFGNKSVGTNYPWVFMSYGVGAVVGPILGGLMGDARAWGWAFLPSGIACLAMGLVTLTLRPPSPRHTAAPT